MDLCYLGLFVLSLLGSLLADGSEAQRSYSMNCGFEDVLSFTESFDGVSFFINKNAVDQSEFCEAMEFYFASGCLLYHDKFHSTELTRIGEKYCSSGFSVNVHEQSTAVSVDSFRIKGRELLQHLSSGSSISDDPRRLSKQLKANFSRDDQWSDGKGKEHCGYPLTPKNMVVAASATFLLCCGLLCPCFRAKRKDGTDHDSKELKRMDLVTSSFDLSSHSEKLPGSPFRFPVPPSPLRVPQSPSRFSLSPQLSRTGSVHPSIDQIIKATQNFSESCIIGEGGFGTVYKAQMPDGQLVAIKRARKEQFATARAEFRSEVDLLSKIEHRNLVSLLGCIDKGNELIIITEYVSNGTLREHLDGQHGKILNFNQRIEISIDVAHALTYLHLYAEKSIIHRDVKSSNILLTESFKAKVADFGFARAGPTDEDKTHISTKVKGTAGYLDPEYLKTYRLTTKSDVFSYGILLMEIISGRRPVEMKRTTDERITIRWAFRKHNGGNSKDVLDPLLREVVEEEVLSKMLALAFQCSAPTRADRPPMKLVVEKLWEIRKLYRSHRRE